LIKGFRQIAVLTTLSRILGMVRDMTFAFFLGRTELMDIWVIAFKIPNLSRRIFGEGALSSSFIPVYIEQLKRDAPAARRLAGTVVGVLLVLLSSVVAVAMGVLALYCWRVRPLPETQLMLVLAAVMLPYMVLICTVAALAGILQSHRHFAAPAAAPVLLNMVVIASLWFSGRALGWAPEEQVGFVAVGVLVAGLLQLALQLGALRRIGFDLHVSWHVKAEPFKRVMTLMAPMVLGLTVTQINTLADDVIARLLSGSEAKGEFFFLLGQQVRYPVWAGAVSSLFYSQRLYQFPLGVLGISLATAIFPVMSSDAARGDMRALIRTVSRGIRASIFVAIPATAGLFLIGRPLVSAIFEQGRFTSEDTPRVAVTLLFYALGLSGYFMQQITTRAFYSLQDPTTPCRSAILAVGVNVVLNLVLIWPLGTGGLAVATAVCSYLQVAVLSHALHRRLGQSALAGAAGTLVKTLLATLVMVVAGGAVLWLLKSWPASRTANVARIGAVVPVAALVYLGAAKALKIESLTLLTGARKRRTGKA